MRKTVESWGEVKSLPSQWEGERILAPILPVYNESKMAAKHSKDEKDQNPHQNRLHCRLLSTRSLNLLQNARSNSVLFTFSLIGAMVSNAF